MRQMLTRLYIDNYRCFENFEFKPAGRQLILGGNGSGKSSFMDALGFLQRFVVEGTKLLDMSAPGEPTRWLNQPTETFELDAKLGDDQYQYRLVLDQPGVPFMADVALETVTCNGELLLETQGAEVRFRRGPEREVTVRERDTDRSALSLAFVQVFPELSKLKRWLGEMRCFRIDPFAMESRSDGEAAVPRMGA